jgi:type VI protein secretion system component Hcp
MKNDRVSNSATKELSDADLEMVTGGGKASPKETVPTETVSLPYRSIEWAYT